MDIRGKTVVYKTTTPEEEKQINDPAGRKRANISSGCVYLVSIYVLPLLTCDFAYSLGLMRGENCELNAALRKNLQRLHVSRSFGQPHTFRLSAEPVFKVTYAPYNLRAFVPAVGKRHNNMVIRLGDGRTVPGKSLLAILVGINHSLINIRCVSFKPR